MNTYTVMQRKKKKKYIHLTDFFDIFEQAKTSSALKLDSEAEH